MNRHIMNKNFSASSRKWLERQQKDIYVKKANDEGYRSRAAYKLIEIDDKFHIIKRAKKIIDVGAAPGGWSQVLSQRANSDAKIAAIDLLKFAPIGENVRQFFGDFENENTQQEIIDYLQMKNEKNIENKIDSAKNSGADLIVSDIAPYTSGNRKTDHLRIMRLVESVYDFANNFLKNNGSFVAKIFQGGEEKVFFDKVKHQFQIAHFFKPKSSRSESTEIYIVAVGFKNES